jgi:hypothetical protein
MWTPQPNGRYVGQCPDGLARLLISESVTKSQTSWTDGAKCRSLRQLQWRPLVMPLVTQWGQVGSRLVAVEQRTREYRYSIGSESLGPQLGSSPNWQGKTFSRGTPGTYGYP